MHGYWDCVHRSICAMGLHACARSQCLRYKSTWHALCPQVTSTGSSLEPPSLDMSVYGLVAAIRVPHHCLVPSNNIEVLGLLQVPISVLLLPLIMEALQGVLLYVGAYSPDSMLWQKACSKLYGFITSKQVTRHPSAVLLGIAIHSFV